MNQTSTDKSSGAWPISDPYSFLFVWLFKLWMLTPLGDGRNQFDAFKVQCTHTPVHPAPHPWHVCYQCIRGLVLRGNAFPMFGPFFLYFSLTNFSFASLHLICHSTCSSVFLREYTFAIREKTFAAARQSTKTQMSISVSLSAEDIRQQKTREWGRMTAREGVSLTCLCALA